MSLFGASLFRIKNLLNRSKNKPKLIFFSKHQISFVYYLSNGYKILIGNIFEELINARSFP